jgi:hypothetical protein
MYSMPGEVLNGEKPGLLGLNMYQMFAIVMVLLSGPSLFKGSLVGYVVFVSLAWLLAKRVRGLYVGEYLYYVARWRVRSVLAQYGLAASDPDRLDPKALYGVARDSTQGNMLIVRRPSGETLALRQG